MEWISLHQMYAWWSGIGGLLSLWLEWADNQGFVTSTLFLKRLGRSSSYIASPAKAAREASNNQPDTIQRLASEHQDYSYVSSSTTLYKSQTGPRIRKLMNL